MCKRDDAVSRPSTACRQGHRSGADLCVDGGVRWQSSRTSSSWQAFMSIIKQVCRSPSWVAWANDSYRFIFPAADFAARRENLSQQPDPGLNKP